MWGLQYLIQEVFKAALRFMELSSRSRNTNEINKCLNELKKCLELLASTKHHLENKSND